MSRQRGLKMEEREEFLRQALAAGCPEEQVRNFISGKVFLQPRQLVASAAARSCDGPDGPTAVGYGGARGGGKSHWLLAQMGATCGRTSKAGWRPRIYSTTNPSGIGH